MAAIPEEVKSTWRFVRPNKPQIVGKDPVTMVFSSDLTGIVITNDRYVCTVRLDLPSATILEDLYQSKAHRDEDAPPDKATDLIWHRGYPLDDPKSLDKAIGFLVKMIRNYLCPFPKPIQH